LVGYKFETLCLLPSIWAETSRDYIENRENEIVNNHAQYCSVVKTGIGNTVMVLGGEVDAGMCFLFLWNMVLIVTSVGF
jgi:RAT1-interacting protein